MLQKMNMKKILDLIFSTKLMGVLFLVFAGTMAVATFIENDYGTPTARKLVYSAWWFEMIMGIFVLNFAGNIFRFRLYRREKWPVLTFHLSFILILVGAWVTRYVSYEGMMSIMEGQSSSKFLTEKIYLSVADENGKDLIVKPILLGQIGNNHFSAKSDDGTVQVAFDSYVPNAIKELKPKDDGAEYFHLVESTGGRTDYYIKKDSVIFIQGVPISFSDNLEIPGIHFFSENGKLKIKSPKGGTFMVMATQANGEVVADSIQDFQLRALYKIGDLNIVVPSPPQRGEFKYRIASKKEKEYFPNDKLGVRLTANGETKTLDILGRQYSTDGVGTTYLGGKKYKVSYGSRYIKLPFEVALRDFQLERYPGSNSPMSYASEITVNDSEKDEHFDFKIFMNNILHYRGYKFFQSSYSITPQGEETRLSVNHDNLGTILTYIGYGLLYLGLVLMLILPGTRFSALRHKLRKMHRKTTILIGFFFFFLANQAIFAQAHDVSNQIDIETFLAQTAIPKTHADVFSHLVIQDAGGRMKPVNTYSSELLRKLSKKDSYHGYNADQILMSMILNPKIWYYAPVIYIEKFDTGIREILGIDKGDKYARLFDFFDEQGGYKLSSHVETATKERIKNAFDKAVLDIDLRANLLYGVLDKNRLRLFPVQGDPNNKWYSASDVEHFKAEDSLYVANILLMYSNTMMQAKASGNDSLALDLLNSINKFQATYGAAVLPDKKQIDFEILYNKYDIFKKLFSYYMMVGTLLFLFVIFHIFKETSITKWLIRISIGIIVLLFLLHTTGLGVRWYISGHTPWSNAYESMIYVAWSTMFFGLLFGRKSPITMGASAFLTAMMLMIAHWNWMDPAIENLVPVLNSYWLMIHVSIIVASYGPFALSMILGVSALIFMVLTNERNKTHLQVKIKEITYINEMSMTVGLVMLTIGNFLGGQWANESWGRYWGWDPKETWALISIMIYAFILHARLIPGLRGRYIFNVLSVFGFASILMTYFGVNFYLAGLHSYAKGDPAPTPAWMYYFVGALVALAIAAYFGYARHYRKKGD